MLQLEKKKDSLVIEIPLLPPLPLFLLSSPLRSTSSHCPGIYVNEEKVGCGTVAGHVLSTYIYEILFLLINVKDVGMALDGLAGQELNGEVGAGDECGADGLCGIDGEYDVGSEVG